VVGEAGGPDLYSPEWSPDGRWIAYSTDNPWFTEIGSNLGNTAASRLWVVPAEGGTPIEVAGGGFLSESPAWTPDSRSLLFVSNRDAVRDVWRVRLRADGRPAEQPERLTTGLSPMTLSLSADGSRLAFTGYDARQNLHAIPVPDEVEELELPAGIPVTSGTQHVDGFALSPDGGRIAFTADRAGRSELFVAPLGLDGRAGEAARLTSGPFDDGVTDWSEDGWIAFHRIEGSKRSAWVIREDGTGARRVTSDTANERYPTFGAGGRLAFSSESLGVRRIVVTERRGEGWSTPRSLGPGDLPRFTPDGSRVFARGPGGVILIDVATGRRDTIDAPAGSMDPNTGAMLLVRTEPEPMLYLRDSAGRERPVFRPSRTSVGMAGGGFPELHGDLVYIGVKESRFDVWTLELSGE
jgi:Tol biopolymer transport system component